MTGPSDMVELARAMAAPITLSCPYPHADDDPQHPCHASCLGECDDFTFDQAAEA